jgi:hypothetical protein
VRISIKLDLKYETDGFEQTNKEVGRIVHELNHPTHEELVEHIDWWADQDIDKNRIPELIMCLDPDMDGVLDQASTPSGGVYQCTLEWQGTELVSASFGRRPAAEGEIYIPMWSEYESKEAFQSSIDYTVALAAGGIPKEHYNLYLDVMTARGIGWGDDDHNDDAKVEYSHDEMLEKAIFTKAPRFSNQ